MLSAPVDETIRETLLIRTATRSPRSPASPRTGFPVRGRGCTDSCGNRDEAQGGMQPSSPRRCGSGRRPFMPPSCRPAPARTGLDARISVEIRSAGSERLEDDAGWLRIAACTHRKLSGSRLPKVRYPGRDRTTSASQGKATTGCPLDRARPSRNFEHRMQVKGSVRSSSGPAGSRTAGPVAVPSLQSVPER